MNESTYKHIDKPIQAYISHTSFHGAVPAVLDKAIETPIIKKPNLDADDLANYCLVSSIPFISNFSKRLCITTDRILER